MKNIEKRIKRLEKIVDLKPWEVHEFSWGTAIKHRNGSWERIFLKPTGQEIDVTRVPVLLSDVGIEFLI